MKTSIPIAIVLAALLAGCGGEVSPEDGSKITVSGTHNVIATEESGKEDIFAGEPSTDQEATNEATDSNTNHETTGSGNTGGANSNANTNSDNTDNTNSGGGNPNGANTNNNGNTGTDNTGSTNADNNTGSANTDSDTTLADEQANKADTTTANVQNKETRMARMVQENKLTHDLVNTITAESADSGAWSSPQTWKGGKVPKDGDRILIHANHRVVINQELTTHYRTIKLEGELAFNPHKNTRLYVDTLLSESGSILRIGEPRHPIDADKTARLIISDYHEEGMITNDPNSPDYDPLRIGQGIITNGLFLAHGAQKTPYVAIEGNGVDKGSKTVALTEEPEGWRAGDKVVVLGTSPSGTEAEVRTIVSVNGNSVTLDKALTYDHVTPQTNIDDDRLQVHIANLTRNIIIQTDPKVLQDFEAKGNPVRSSRKKKKKESGDTYDPYHVEHRGHVLFMHNNNVNLNYVSFLDLGRTNKKYPLDETKFASSDKDAKATYIGKNQAARYSVHFHRAGLDGKVGRIDGCVVDQSPGWGYVNHSSNVIMKENIAYGVYGASFITEAGDENGIFEGNMAISSRGYGRSDVKGWGKRHQYFGDGGFQGNGFWIIGPYVDIVDNIVNGSSNSAFAMKRSAIDDVTGVVRSDDESEVAYSEVGLKSFTGNIAYGNSGGVFGILGGTRQKSTEHIVGLLAWNNDAMTNDELLSWWYPDDIVIENTTLIGDINNPKHTGIGTQTKLRKTVMKNIKIEGLQVGLRVPSYVGPNSIENAYLNNVVNMLYIAGTTNKGANTRISGDIEYGTLPGNVTQTKMKFALKVRNVSFKNYLDRQFHAFNIVYAPNGETPMKLYMTKEQSPDYKIEIGREDVKGKTNAQLVKEGHKPVGGELLPANAKPMPGMDNVSGAPTGG